MLNEVDNAPEVRLNGSSTADNAAMAAYVQELYSSARQGISKVIESAADSLGLNDLQLDFGPSPEHKKSAMSKQEEPADTKEKAPTGPVNKADGGLPRLEVPNDKDVAPQSKGPVNRPDGETTERSDSKPDGQSQKNGLKKGEGLGDGRHIVLDRIPPYQGRVFPNVPSADSMKGRGGPNPGFF